MKTVDTASEESFSKTVGRSMSFGTSSSVTTQVSTKTSAEASVSGFGMSAKISHEESKSRGTSYSKDQLQQSSSELQTQSKKTYSYQIQDRVINTIERDLSNPPRGYAELTNQLINLVKYDLWTPVRKISGDGIDDPTKVMRETLTYTLNMSPDSNIIARYDAQIFKAYDLPGDQYYIHTTEIQDYPTQEFYIDWYEIPWVCGSGPILEDHDPIQEPKNALHVFLKPTKNHANIIVTDYEFFPVKDATVKLGIPSFPLTKGADACTRIDRTAKTDSLGSAYFYLESVGTSDPYVFDGINVNSKPDGLVAMFPGNGDFTDLVSPGRTLISTNVSFEDGIIGDAFDLRGNSQGVQFTDVDDLDLTRAVTISAWIKPSSVSGGFQAIAVKSTIVGGLSSGGSQHDRNYGLWITPGTIIQLSYVNTPRGGGTNNIVLNSPANIINNDNWYHVAGVIDTEKNFMGLYINGNLVKSSSNSLRPMIPASDIFSIGIEPGSSGSRLFKGLIDEVAIYDKALSDAEISQLRHVESKSSACPDSQASGNNKLTVSHSDFNTISRDLVYFVDEYNEFWYAEPGPEVVDNDPPILVVPKTKRVEATSEAGANVDYVATAYDAVDKEITPVCNPSSGAEFPIGSTTVRCSAQDSIGNKATKSFNVVVTSGGVVIPSWVKDIAGFWCANEIDSNGFVQVIQWMIDNNLIIIPEEMAAQAASDAGSGGVPDWIQFNACIWYQGEIGDKEFSTTLEWLINNGIIQV